MTLVLELPVEVDAALRKEAEAQGRPVEELAAEALSQAFPPEEDPTFAESIARGLADIEAGRTVTIEEASAHADAALEEFLRQRRTGRRRENSGVDA